ncbi:MAG: sporulation initiation factor Spo0A C-terminal domain-containing protein [Oscillospiraceae bacterium]|nr:sporulation initiation factor Spo0A C-terminal domain-containing protein [Oscillospiraceae bacterium]
MRPYSLFITEDDPLRIKLYQQAAEPYQIKIIFGPKNGPLAMEMIRRLMPDAALLELFLPQFSALELKYRYDEAVLNGSLTPSRLIHFFAFGSLMREEIFQLMQDRNFSFYFLRPLDEKAILHEINYFLKTPRVFTPYCEQVQRSLHQLLATLQAPANHMGYQHIVTGVSLLLENPSYRTMATKRLYPEIAKRNRSPVSSIEKRIRYVLEHIAQNADPELMKRLFPDCAPGERPYVMQFLTVLAHRLRWCYDMPC